MKPGASARWWKQMPRAGERMAPQDAVEGCIRYAVLAVHEAIDLSVLSPELVELAAEKLPASERAELQWEAGRIRTSIRQLVRELNEADKLNEVASELLVVSARLLPKVAKALALSPAVVSAETWVEDAAKEIAPMDAAAADALRWAAKRLLGFSDLMDKLGDADFIARLASVNEAELLAAVRSPAGCIFRALTLMIAAAEAVRDETTRERAPEIAWRAFEEATAVVDLLSAVIEPEPGDPAAFLRAAEWLREALDEDDLRVLDEARMRELR